MSTTTNSGQVKRTPSHNTSWNEEFSKRLPHVFVGIVAFGDIAPEIYESHVLWAIAQGARLKGKFHVSFGIATRKEQYRARNFLIDAAQREGADFMLMIDDDQTLHENVDIIEKFWELGKDIAGGLYYQRGGCYHPVIMKEFPTPNGHKKVRFYHPDEVPTEPTPVDVLGGGCHWVRMEVFDKIKQPFFWPYPVEFDSRGQIGSQHLVYVPDPVYGLDVDFCMRVRALGYECWLHPGIVLGHLSHSREVLDASSRPNQEEIAQTFEYQNYWANVHGAGVATPRRKEVDNPQGS